MLQKEKCDIVLGSSIVRFRRSINFMQRFTITNQFIGWDNRSWYMEQKILNSEGFICAVLYTQSALVYPSKNPETWLPPSYFMKLVLGEECESPELPEEVILWIKFNELSSKSLKKS